jgi:hypothetical protein
LESIEHNFCAIALDQRLFIVFLRFCQSQRKELKQELEELKRDVDILINSFLKEEIHEKSQSEVHASTHAPAVMASDDVRRPSMQSSQIADGFAPRYTVRNG